MRLMKEFLKLHENANRDLVVDQICKACCNAKCKGIPYEKAVGAIAAEFRKLDKRDFSSKMSDEALKDMIMAIYDHDKHLSQDQAVTNYRDVGFSKGQGPGTTPGATDGIVTNTVNQMKEEAGDDQADVATEFNALMKKHKKSMKPADVKKFEKAFDRANKEWLEIYNQDESEDEDAESDQQENLHDAVGELQGVLDDLKHHLKLSEEEGVEPAPKRDLKAEAIGLATKWFKENFKKFSLPLKVKRIKTSGNYIMAAKVASGDKTKWVFAKTTADGNVKQTSVEAWKLEEDFSDNQAPGSLDNQEQGGMPQGSGSFQPGPAGAEKVTPPPDNSASATPPKTAPNPNRVIAKGGDFRVELGQNEQVSIIDGKGNIRLSMPMVIWKELTRQ